MDRAIKLTYKGKQKKLQKQIADGYAANFGEVVKKGFGKGMFDMQWESPDDIKYKHLQTNVYEFSHAKSYEQLKALTTSLYDKDGNIVPEKEFFDIASRINNEIAFRHLKIERETALAGGAMASKWVRFEKDEDIYPNLMFETAGDSRVRPSHAKLDGVVKPLRDAFWDRNTPPLGWGCRCDLRQATGGRKITPSDTIAEPEDTPPMFQQNFAKGGMVFPPDHPYFEHLPKEIKSISKKGNPFKYEKVSKGKKGGYLYNSTISKAASHELEMAETLANEGRKVIYLPEVNSNNATEKALRELILPKEYNQSSKNVDALIDGKLYEFKKATKGSLQDRIEDTFSKCERLVIKTTGVDKKHLIFKIEQFKNKYPNAKVTEVIWIDDNNKVEVFAGDFFKEKES